MAATKFNRALRSLTAACKIALGEELDNADTKAQALEFTEIASESHITFTSRMILHLYSRAEDQGMTRGTINEKLHSKIQFTELLSRIDQFQHILDLNGQGHLLEHIIDVIRILNKRVEPSWGK